MKKTKKQGFKGRTLHKVADSTGNIAYFDQHNNRVKLQRGAPSKPGRLPDYVLRYGFLTPAPSAFERNMYKL